MELTKELEEAIVAPGPQGFHPPSAAELGVLTPEKGHGLKFGHAVAEELAMEAMARQPEMAGKIQTAMLIAAALVEGVALFGVVASLLEVLG